MIDQNQLAADQAALDAQQATDDAARAALATADTDLQAAKDKLVADTQAYDAEQTAVAANPVLGVLDQMEKTVDDFASQVGVGVSNLFRQLIAQARAIVEGPATAPAPADPVQAPTATVADDAAGSVEAATNETAADAAATADAQGSVVAAADSGAELTSGDDTPGPDVTQASAA